MNKPFKFWWEMFHDYQLVISAIIMTLETSNTHTWWEQQGNIIVISSTLMKHIVDLLDL